MEGLVRIFFFFFILMVSSGSEDVKSNLTGIEGGSITLPDPVLETGFLTFRERIIAMVKRGEFDILEEIYKDRLLWNNITGLFTIRGLQRTDSGVYSVKSKEGSSTSHKLTVYEPVAAPAVNTVKVSAESCTLMCSLDKAEETTLLWYKDEEILNQSSSALSLPLTVHRQDFTSSYRCVAENPAENKTLHVNVTTSCGGQSDTNNNNTSLRQNVGIPIALSAVILVVSFLIWKFFVHNKKKTSETQADNSLA